jgi:kynurenine 3-monooxygenase
MLSDSLPSPVAIVGAGPTGALLAILLERRGIPVRLYESRPDPRQSTSQSGRSINLALAERGIHALKLAGVFDRLEASLIPMRGRFVHQHDGSGALQPYGQRPNEVIYSISRHRLNQVLLEVASSRQRIQARFRHRLEDANFASNVARVRDLENDVVVELPMMPLIAADGAGSKVRHLMAARGLIQASEIPLEHGYKEFSIAADSRGRYRMEREALHVWPRGGYMLIALPNLDGSFTATLFLPLEGPLSFASLHSPRAIDEFLSRNFPDARALMPDCVAEFTRHPTGFLGTIYASPWHHAGSAALIGDSAHAIVPFHGQGMNCCFEDCAELDALLDDATSWEKAFADFYARRKPNTDAIAGMAIENYLEMRERVADPGFQLQAALSHELERRFPQRFIPRYSMVMFHHEIEYRTARERGAIQAQLLARLTAHAAKLADIDYASAASEIEARLPPLSSVTPARA